MDAVFAYGSNMHLSDLARWATQHERPVPTIHSVHTGQLRSYGRVWNYYSAARQGGAANVEPRAGHEVWGLVLMVDRDTLETMDRKEGHPNRYTRGERQQSIWLPETQEFVSAWVYEVTPEFVCDREIYPTHAYLALIIEACKVHGLPEAEMQRLRCTKTQASGT